MAGLDLLIRGATVYPGDAPPFEGDVGVRGGTIDLVAREPRAAPRPPVRPRPRSSTAAG